MVEQEFQTSPSLSRAAPTSSWPNLPDISGCWHQRVTEGTPHSAEIPGKPACKLCTSSLTLAAVCSGIQARALELFKGLSCSERNSNIFIFKGREVQLLSGHMPGNISVITFCYVAMSAFSTPLIRQEKSGERSSQFPPCFLG